MTSLLDKISDLNDMILDGKAMEAFEKYYDDDVIMQENTAAPTVGKSANRKREEEFFGNITEFRGARPLRVTTGPDVTMVEWHFDYSHKEWGVCNYTQVSVQQWKDGKIIAEKFYYGT